MASKLLQALLLVTAILCGVCALAVAVFWAQGSAEAFPTAEQQEKVNLAYGLVIALLIGVEAAVWLVWRHVRPVSPC